MDIKRVKQELKDTIEAYLLKDGHGAYVIPAIRQRPVLLIGPPGVGKTQIMEQVARECGIGLVSYTITHHTRQSAIGLPFISQKTYGGEVKPVTEYTMSEIVASVYDEMERTGLKEGILFIDEINCVSETLAPAMLQFLQAKTFGNHAIPEGWIIAAAGNPPEYNKSVREFDVVTLDRIKMIHVEADFDVWKEYAYAVSIHPAIISYLDIKKQHFCQIETTVDGRMFATPRGWEDLSRLMEVYETLKKPVDRDVISQYIQFPAISKDFANYLELYYKYEDDYQVDEILSGVVREGLCDRLKRARFDEKMSVTSLILAKLTSRFREVVRQETLLSELQGRLKKLPQAGGDEKTLAEYLEELTTVLKSERDQKKTAKLLTRGEDYLYQDQQEILEQYLRILNEENPQNFDMSWNRLRELFGEESDRFEAASEQAGTMLEHAFDFMEAAFGDSQELVIFVTELNTNYYSVRFLQEYDCERYYQYNKKLLFEDREKNILSRISGE